MQLANIYKKKKGEKKTFIRFLNFYLHAFLNDLFRTEPNQRIRLRYTPKSEMDQNDGTILACR